MELAIGENAPNCPWVFGDLVPHITFGFHVFVVQITEKTSSIPCPSNVPSSYLSDSLIRPPPNLLYKAIFEFE